MFIGSSIEVSFSTVPFYSFPPHVTIENERLSLKWFADTRSSLFCDSTDIKSSNILFNSKGQIKICDFGVSGELIDSIADTFNDTPTYMSECFHPLDILHASEEHQCVGCNVQPVCIQGAQYTVKFNVWSLGVSLIKLPLVDSCFLKTRLQKIRV